MEGCRLGRKTVRVLVVDDEPAVAEVIAAVLEEAGYTVLTARTGRDALEDAVNLDYDLLITDVVMPEVSGWELIEAVRAQKPQVRVIAISGGGGAFTADIALDISRRRGATTLLRKPVEIDVLLDAVGKNGG